MLIAERASVPGSGTAHGVCVIDNVLSAEFKLQPNAPATGFTKPVVSNAEGAFN
jgi:hypothetical protein